MSIPTMKAESPGPLECTVPPAPNESEDSTALEQVCRICLHSGGNAMVTDIDDTLAVFYDELIYFDTYEHKALSYCQICEYQLRRFYNFRQKCKRAHILLKTKAADRFEPERIKNLQTMIPLQSIGICTAKSNQKVYDSVFTEHNLENAVEEDPESKLDENVTSFTEHSLLIKKIGTDDLQKLEKVEQHTQQNNIESGTDLKSYIQDFLKHDDDGLSNEHYNVNNNNDVKSTAKSKMKVRKKKKILTKFEKIERRRENAMNRFKHNVLIALERGDLKDIEDLGVKISEEVFVRLLDRCQKGTFMQTGLANSNFTASNMPKIRAFIQSLLERYNPVYEDMFDVTYLHTYEKRVEEFNARKHSDKYKEAVFKCEICYQVYELQGLLDFHMKWHDESLPIPCTICSMRFMSEKTLKCHLNQTHREKFCCKLCSFITYQHGTMKNHYRDHKRYLYQCPECEKKFSKHSSMKNHYRNTHNVSTLCSVCGRRLPSEIKLRSHMAQKHSDFPAETLASTPTECCTNCKAAFHTAEALVYHASAAHRTTCDTNEDQEISYACFYCKVDFDTIEALYTHKRSEEHRLIIQNSSEKRPRTGRKPYRTCPLCNEEVLNVHTRSLYDHYRTEHPAAAYHPEPEVEGFLCEQCGQTFIQKHLYQDHQNLHTGAKPYECSECGERFALRARAYKHLRQHRRVLTRKTRLYRARRSPTSFPCKICMKIFKSRFFLERHQVAHTGEKPHKCPMCGKGFSQAAAIKLHITTVHLKLPAPYKSRARAEQGAKTTAPWKPRAGIAVPPMSLELLQSYVLGPWKNDLEKLKAVLDVNKQKVEDEFDQNEEEMEDASNEKEELQIEFDYKKEEMDDMSFTEEVVVEEPCDSDF